MEALLTTIVDTVNHHSIHHWWSSWGQTGPYKQLILLRWHCRWLQVDPQKLLPPSESFPSNWEGNVVSPPINHNIIELCKQYSIMFSIGVQKPWVFSKKQKLPDSIYFRLIIYTVYNIFIDRLVPTSRVLLEDCWRHLRPDSRARSRTGCRTQQPSFLEYCQYWPGKDPGLSDQPGGSIWPLMVTILGRIDTVLNSSPPVSSMKTMHDKIMRFMVVFQ